MQNQELKAEVRYGHLLGSDVAKTNVKYHVKSEVASWVESTYIKVAARAIPVPPTFILYVALVPSPICWKK